MQGVVDDEGLIVDPPTGHGLGLAVRDLPVLVSYQGGAVKDDCIEVSADIPLEPNMVLNVEVSAFLPGVASVEIEKTVVVTTNGFNELIDRENGSLVRL